MGLPIYTALRRYGVASPYGLATGACLVFLVGWTFPPALYSYYLSERDLMFLDPYSFFFFFFCILAFLSGLRLVDKLKPDFWTKPLPRATAESPVLYLMLPLIVSFVVCVISLRIVGSHVNFLALLASQQGQSIKNYGGKSTAGTGIWTKTPMLLTGVLWWIQLRMQQLKINTGVRVFISCFWFIGFFLNAFTYVAEVDRTALIPLILGSFLINIFKKEASGRLPLRRALMYAGIGAGFIVGAFLLMAFLRGNTVSYLMISSLLGYSICSYNRFAGVLNGHLHYVYGGKGVYLFLYLDNAPALERLFHITSYLNWPSYLEVFNSEYASMALAGLNLHYIWAGVFGYLYADIGWWTLLYLFCTGIFTGYIWGSLRRGSSVAVVLYPWIASWIAGWNTSNILFNDDFVHLIPVAIALAFWDKLFLAQHEESEAASASVPARYGMTRSAFFHPS